MGTYFMAHTLTQGRYKSTRSSFESRRKRGEANSILRGSVWYAGQMVSLMDSLFSVHVSKYMCMYLQVASQPASLSSYMEKVLVRKLFTTESVLVCSSPYNTETDMHTCFSSSVSTCNQVFQQALFGVLPGIFLSLSFFLSTARSLYLALAPSLCSFITSRLLGPCFLSWLES